MTTALRPLTTGELLDTTFSLYRSHFLLFVGLVALPYFLVLPLEVTNIVINAGAADLLFLALFWLVIAFVTLIVAAASQGATLVAVSEIYLGRPATLRSAFARIRGRVAGLCVLMIVMGLGIAVGLVLLIVPGVILALMWSLAVPVAVIEEETIGASLSRSAELTKGFRLRVLLIWFLFLILTWIVSLLLSVPAAIAGMLSAFAHSEPGGLMAPVMPGWVLVLNVITTFVARCLVGPLMSIAFAVLYYDVRVRKEAFDLQVMMEALDGTGAAGTTGQGGP